MAIANVFSNSFSININKGGSGISPPPTPDLPSVTPVKSELSSAKSTYDTKYTNLKNQINTILSKTNITEADRTALNSKLSEYKSQLSVVVKTFDKAIDNISQNKANNAQDNAVQNSMSQFSILADKIVSKVSGDEFSSVIEQTKSDWNATFDAGYKKGNTNISADGITVTNGAFTLKNKKNQSVFSANSDGDVSMGLWNSKFTLSATGDRKAEMWCDYYDKFILQVPYTRVDGGLWIKRDTGATILSDLVKAESIHYKIYIGDMQTPSAKIGNLYVTGDKNCLQETKNYGERLVNAYETAEYYFGDIGSGIIKDGQCIVLIDDILLECINTNVQYHVFTQCYNGAITKIERFPTYFIVHGEDESEFSWELKAKRIKHENSRLDVIDENQREEIDDLHSILDDGDYVNKNNLIELENILINDIFELEYILLGGI